MELELDHGRKLRIEKDFAKGDTKVVDLKTGKRIEKEFEFSKELSDFRIGDALLDMPRPIFERAVVVRQNELELGLVTMEKSVVKANLERLVDVAGGGRTAAEALARLEEAIRKYPGTTSKGSGRIQTSTEISRLNNELQALESKLRELEAKRHQTEEDLYILDQMSKDLSDRQARVQALESLLAEAELKELRGNLQKLRELNEERLELEEWFKKLFPYDPVPLDEEAKVEQAYGRYKQAVERLESKREKIRQLERKLKGLEEESERTFGSLAQVAPESRKRAALLISQWQQLAKRYYSLSQRANAERLNLASQTIAAEEFDQLFTWISNLPAVVVHKLASQAEEGRRIGQEIKTLEESKESLSNQERDVRRTQETWGRRAITGWILSLIMLALGVAWVWGGPQLPPEAVLGAAVLAILPLLLPTAAWVRAHRSLFAVKSRVSEVAESIRMIREQLQRLDDELLTLATSAGAQMEPVALVRAKHRRYQLLREHCEAYREASREMLLAQDELFGLSNELRPFLSQARIVVAEELTEEHLRELEKRLEALENLERQMAQTRQDLESLSNEAAEAQGASIRALEEIRSAVALLPPAVRADLKSVEELRGLFIRAVQHKKHLEEVKRNLSRVEKDLAMLSEPENELLERIDLKRKQVEQLSRGVEPRVLELRSDLPVDEWRNRLRAAGAEFQENQQELIGHRDKLKDTLKVTDEISRVRAERDQIKSNLEAVDRFDSVVNLAIESIKSVSQGTYHDWAEHLNTQVQELLSDMSEVYKDIMFHDDLSFSLYTAEKQGRLSEEEISFFLSSGARALIYLAVRLAMIRFFSRREKVPLILDDSLTDFDDQRFEEVMRLLGGLFARAHQIVLLTCHEQQYSRWFEKHPEFKAHLIEGILPDGGN